MATHTRHEIAVYPSRAKLLRYALLYLVVVSFLSFPCIAFSSSAFTPDSRAHLPQAVPGICAGAIFGIMILFIALLLLFTLYRILVRKPSVIVNSDGIVDHCSLIVGGLGLMRWDDIEVLMPAEYKKGTAYLFVMPRDGLTFPDPDNLLARLFQRSITFMLPVRSGLPQWLLSISVSELAAQIQEHYHATLAANDIGILDFLHTSET